MAIDRLQVVSSDAYKRQYIVSDKVTEKNYPAKKMKWIWLGHAMRSDDSIDKQVLSGHCEATKVEHNQRTAGERNMDNRLQLW